ncbi:hypothetical protein [Shimia sp.]|uniref:hypothetical protein n=1 Tax=Shimia sp. TaxID=1954381 RepID=UPI003BAC59AD
MTRVRPSQLAFSSGEIQPLLHSRPDYQRYQTGLAKCIGFLPLQEGGVTRAPGSIYRGNTRNNAYARNIPFQFSEEDALTLEFTDGRMRVWRYGALVQSGGSPYELVTPYAEAALDKLDFVQSADAIYLVDGEQPMQKLQRMALNDWSIAPVDLADGPFRVQNLDEAVTIQCSASAGTITLTGVGTDFDADWVGSLIQFKPTDFSNVALWTGNTNIGVGEYMRYGDNIYRLEAGSNTGVNPPVHTSGTRLVQKDPAVRWAWVSDTVGIVKITAVANAISATAEVLREIPKPCVDDPTYRWSEGAWSKRWGYPSAIVSAEQRLFAGFTASEPRTIWASVIGALESFLPGDLPDDAFAYTISGSETLNRGNWLTHAKKGVYIGALGEVFRGFSASAGQAIGPTTFDTDLEGTNGCTAARPIKPFGYPIYITKDGARVEELRFSFEVDGGKPLQLSLPSKHLGNSGFKQIVWQSSPQGYGWLRRGAGDLVVFLYDPEEDVLGWAPVPVAGGHVEDLTVTTDATNGYDIVTMVVRRVINGQTVRLVEEQALIWGVIAQEEPIYKAVHLFAASVFDQPGGASEFDVPHLIGQTVYVWTNQGEYGPIVVPASGRVTLPETVTHAVVGLLDETHKIRTLNVSAQAPDGSPIGREQRLNPGAGIYVHRTAAGKIRTVTRDVEEGEVIGEAANIIPRGVAADLINAYSGVLKTDVESGHASEVFYEMFPTGGAPMTIGGLVPDVSEVGA